MTKVVQNINIVLKYKEKIVTVLIIGIVMSACMYAYLLHNAIENVIAREEIRKEMSSVSTNVSELEGKYFSVKNAVNIELAHAKGFKDTPVDSFISKKSLTAMVNHNEL